MPARLDRHSSANKRARRRSRWACGLPHTGAARAGPTRSPSGHGALRPASGLARLPVYPLSSLWAQQNLADGTIGMATIDLSTSVPLCQSPVVRFRYRTMFVNENGIVRSEVKFPISGLRARRENGLRLKFPRPIDIEQQLMRGTTAGVRRGLLTRWMKNRGLSMVHVK
jgi:hypothetical protein